MFQLLKITTILSLVLLVASCGGSGLDSRQDPAGLPLLEGLPTIAELDDRVASVIQQLPIDPTLPAQSAGTVTVVGSDLLIDSDPGTASWAMYSVNVTGLELIQLDVEAILQPGDGFWYGVANYAQDRWEFQARTTTSSSSVSLTETVDREFASPLGNLYFIAISYDDEDPLLTGVTITGDDGISGDFSLSGSVIAQDTSGLADVDITVNPGNHMTTTDLTGAWSIGSLGPGNYTVTPQKAFHVMTPASQMVEIINSSMPVAPFVGVKVGQVTGTVLLDGTDALENVQMTITPGNLQTTTDVNGEFSFEGLVNGDYTLNAELLGYSFDPNDLEFMADDSNLFGLAITASELPAWNISGTIEDDGMLALAGVTVTLDPGGTTDITDASGNYSFVEILQGGPYTLTPSLAGYTFDPVDITIPSLTGNLTGQDFEGTAAVVTFDADIFPIINGSTGETSCLQCHPPTLGHDWSVYAEVFTWADTINDRINREDADFQQMPQPGPKWSQGNLDLFQAWIDGGKLEN